jgi:hypothetical protein
MQQISKENEKALKRVYKDLVLLRLLQDVVSGCPRCLPKVQMRWSASADLEEYR